MTAPKLSPGASFFCEAACSSCKGLGYVFVATKYNTSTQPCWCTRQSPTGSISELARREDAAPVWALERIAELESENTKLRKVLKKSLRVITDVIVHKRTPETWKIAYRVKADAKELL